MNIFHKRQGQVDVIWKRDPLAIPVSTEKIFISKLEYIIILLNGTYALILKNTNGVVQDFIGKALMTLICLLIIKNSRFRLVRTPTDR